MVTKTQSAYGVSERRACDVLHHPRATHRYQSVKDDQAALRGRIREIARATLAHAIRRLRLRDHLPATIRPYSFP
ncbi:MAG: hypothetical protein AAFY46_08615, partial [Planctomycetota bacterium]